MSDHKPARMSQEGWDGLSAEDQAAVVAMADEVRVSAKHLEDALQQVATHRALSRKFAEQAKGLAAQMRRSESADTPPSAVLRMAELAEDLEATSRGADRRTHQGGSGDASSYTPPFPVEDEELKVPTVVSFNKKA